MDNRFPPTRVLQYVVILGMFIAAAWLYPLLPSTIPVHWGIGGEPNGWASKTWSAWLMPVIALLITILFPIFARIDPKHDNYKDFAHAWNVLQLVLVAFFAYIEGITFYQILHPVHGDFMGRAILVGLGLLYVIIGNYMGKIRQNFFIGLRTPWSLSDPEVWQKSQRFSGWAFVIGGIATVILGLMAAAAFTWFFVILAIIVIVPIIYSYVLYRQRHRQ